MTGYLFWDEKEVDGFWAGFFVVGKNYSLEAFANAPYALPSPSIAPAVFAEPTLLATSILLFRIAIFNLFPKNVANTKNTNAMPIETKTPAAPNPAPSAAIHPISVGIKPKFATTTAIPNPTIHGTYLFVNGINVQ